MIIRLRLLQKTQETNIILKKVLKILPSKNISDHWKEIMVPTYAFMLIKKCAQMFLILVGIILVSVVFYLISPSFYTLVISIIGILESIAVIALYTLVKKRI